MTISPAQSQTQPHYQEPSWFTTHIFNRLFRRLARMGMSVRGSRELRVRGRTSGQWQSIPVNPLTLGSERYLVAPRGETQWVRNLRAAGGGELRVGRTVEIFRAAEVADADKASILRQYLEQWKFEVGVFFEGVDDTATDDDLVAIGHRHPVFLLV